jgi:sulfate transport system permease protein
MREKKTGVLPGFGLSMGYTLSYLGLVVLIPFAALILKSMGLTWGEFWATVTDPRLVASYKLSFLTALAGALINAVFGLVVAWVLVRYEFPGRRWVDAMVDLPFALPTAVAGIALTTLYSPNGWLGKYLEPLGIHVAYTPLGITAALTFIGIPFVVRTVQPVLESLDPELEKAAVSLGANRWHTITRVVLPSLFPAWLTGVSLAFARALGEYGSVVFISGNLPFKTEITPLLIISKLEQYKYAEATAIAVVMLTASFLILLTMNYLQARSLKYLRAT